MERNDIIKLCIVVGLLVVAVILYIAASEEEPIVDEAKTAWFCESCNRGFELTGEEMRDRVSRTRGGIASETDGADAAPKARIGGRGMIQVARCPYCDKWTGFVARRCSTCGKIYRAKTEDGQVPSCPYCEGTPSKTP